MSTKDTTVPSEVPILDGSNYRTWEQMMKSFLQTKGLYRLIRATYHIPSGLSEAQCVTTQYGLIHYDYLIHRTGLFIFFQPT